MLLRLAINPRPDRSRSTGHQPAVGSKPGREYPAWLRQSIEVLVVAAAMGLDLLGSGPNLEFRDGQIVPWAGLLVVAATYWTLLVRWRYPVAVLALHVTIYGVLLSATDFVSISPMLVAVHAVARTRRGPTAISCLVVSLVASLTMGLVVDSRQLTASVILCVLQGGSFVIGRWGRVAEERATERQAELARSAQREADLKLQAERLQLARDLHDIVSHSVSAMLLQAAGARAVLASGRPDSERGVTDALTSIENAGVQAMRELRRLLGLLRDQEDPGADVEGSSLLFIDSLIETTRLSGVDVSYNVEGVAVPLDPSVDLAAYRVVQESLANVMKHGGTGAQASVRLSWTPTTLDIRVRSVSGFGGAEAPAKGLVPRSGFGLRGLAERLELIDGTFRFGPVAGGCFLTWATIPITDSSPIRVVESRAQPRS